MALLQTRGRLLSAICGPVSTGPTGAVTAHTFARSVAGNWTDGGRVRNFDCGSATVVSAACKSAKSARPYGYLPPHSWVLPRTAGGMACNAGRIAGTGTLAGRGAMGVNASAGLAGSSTMSGGGGLIVSAVAALSGSGTLTSADIRGIVNASAALTGSGDLSAGVTALGHLLAALAGTGTLSAPAYATGTLAADILPYSDLSPQGLASAVWDSLAADNNDSGTMGEKLNAAGTAGDPWTAELPGSYAEGTAGNVIAMIAALLRNKTVTDPATGVMTVYAENGVDVLFTANVFEDAAGTAPYDGHGANRRDRLA